MLKQAPLLANWQFITAIVLSENERNLTNLSMCKHYTVTYGWKWLEFDLALKINPDIYCWCHLNYANTNHWCKSNGNVLGN